MVPTSDKLPVVLMLAGVVFIFFYTQKQAASRRIQLWYLGWVFLFLHSVIQFWQSTLPPPRATEFGLVMALNFVSLALPAIFFWLATSLLADHDRPGWPMFCFVGIPATIYVILLGYDASAKPVFFGIIAVVAFSELFILCQLRRSTLYIAGGISVVVAGSAWAGYQVLQGRPDTAFFLFLSVIYGFCAINYRRWQKRFSAAVVSTTVGFLLWTAIAPIIYLISANPLTVLASSGLWNLPAFLVAIGIIVTLLEEQSRAAGVASDRQGALNLQMMRFAELTSQLLSGVDVGKFCEHVAAVIAEAGDYSQVFIVLADDVGRFSACGHSGISTPGTRFLKTQLAQYGVKELNVLCQQAPRIGPNSYRASLTGQLRKTLAERPAKGEVAGDLQEFEKFMPAVDDHRERLVPLRAPNASYLGCIVLRKPKANNFAGPALGEEVSAENLASIELLGADLAIALENSNLQQHLLRSERLAGIGQLVSGVAHELNNPLTAVMGYTEMLMDRATDEQERRELEIVQREALRMKNIIQNLLSFARQTKPQRTPVDLATMLDDILKLRAYHLRSHRITVETVLPEMLPMVMVDESLIKQVFMNVLKNAEDAVENLAEKNITIAASFESDRVHIQFKDNGPGFNNLGRAFDPFFTTKGPSQGTGLGLSICYGIVKELGGDITAFNLQPNGGCVAIELPVNPEPKSELAPGGLAGPL